jgi:hypothetical protein
MTTCLESRETRRDPGADLREPVALSMTRRSRRTHSPAFKAKVALAATKGETMTVGTTRRLGVASRRSALGGALVKTWFADCEHVCDCRGRIRAVQRLVQPAHRRDGSVQASGAYARFMSCQYHIKSALMEAHYAARTASALTCHIGSGPGLIDKDQTTRLEPRLPFVPIPRRFGLPGNRSKSHDSSTQGISTDWYFRRCARSIDLSQG